MLAGVGAAGSAPRKSDREPLASAATRERVRGKLAALANRVRLVVFTGAGDAAADEQAVQLAEGLAALSPQVSAEVHNILSEEEQARRFRVERTPAIAVLGEKDCGIRFYGVPGGREVDALVAAIERVSTRDSGLSEASRKALAGLKKPVHIEVFVTLGCSHCPAMVELAQRLAVESDLVTADMVEVSAFPELANSRGVTAAPTVALNGATSFMGRKSEADFVAAVVRAGSGE